MNYIKKTFFILKKIVRLIYKKKCDVKKSVCEEVWSVEGCVGVSVCV